MPFLTPTSTQHKLSKFNNLASKDSSHTKSQTNRTKPQHWNPCGCTNQNAKSNTLSWNESIRINKEWKTSEVNDVQEAKICAAEKSPFNNTTKPNNNRKKKQNNKKGNLEKKEKKVMKPKSKIINISKYDIKKSLSRPVATIYHERGQKKREKKWQKWENMKWVCNVVSRDWGGTTGDAAEMKVERERDEKTEKEMFHGLLLMWVKKYLN